MELDGDHAFGDCGSRRPVKAASKNPCHMRGTPSTEAGRGTSGCYVERPARVDSTSLAEAPASRADVRITRPSWTLRCFSGEALSGHRRRISSGCKRAGDLSIGAGLAKKWRSPPLSR